MGNCNHRIKQKILNSLQNRHQSYQKLVCPNCQKEFEPNTSNQQFNQHLDSCLRDPSSLVQSYQRNNMNFKVQKKSIFKLNRSNRKWEKHNLSEEKVNQIFNCSLKEIKEKTFEQKVVWFRKQNEKRKTSWTEGSEYIIIDKDDIVNSSISFLDDLDFLRELKIQFENEQVSDAGGLVREWINLLISELFSKKTGIFSSNKGLYYFNKNLGTEKNNEQIKKIRLAAKILAKAILERIPVNVQLSPILIKHILQQPIVLEDMKSYDTDLFKQLNYINDNSIGDCLADINFVYIDQNKQPIDVEFVASKVSEMQLKTFLYEFYEVIQKNNVQIFNVDEFGMILNGINEINISDWKNNTVYQGKYNEQHIIIKWFWKIVEEELTKKQVQKIVQFTTSLIRIPVEGFGQLESNRGELCKFSIKDGDRLQAMTCFNRLIVPCYKDYDEMKEQLIQISQTQFEGVFGLKD